MTPFVSALLKVTSFYLVGFGIAYVVSLFSGSYSHGPGVHHAIGFLVLVTGACWGLYNLFRIMRNRRNTFHLAAFIVHVAIIGGVVLYINLLWNDADRDDNHVPSEELTTVVYDSAKKRSRVVNGNGDTLIYKVRDSLLIDKIK